MTDYSRVAVIVPSLEPEADLILPFLASLREVGLTRIIIVDDGSPESYRPIFDRAEKEFGCTVLRHPVNMGKGRALKTAFAYCANLEGIDGVVTADSDGQHAVPDIQAVTEKLLTVPARTAVFGSRDFDGSHVPSKSRKGNKITSRVVQVLFGQWISDTQTGLRGFSVELAQQTALVRGDRFDYEMNVLLWLIGTHHPVVEVPIQTIYHDIDNSVSHFRPIRDSARIYGVIFRQFLKFIASSAAGAVIDIGIYALVVDFIFHGKPVAGVIITATVIARVISSLVNFTLNRHAVFQDASDPKKSLIRYYILAAVLLAASSAGSVLMAKVLDGHLVWAKLIVDGVLFIASYLIQKRWVFADESLESGK
ncbi:MAG: GtrA family protein [Propionibacteriaceae bacterium]